MRSLFKNMNFRLLFLGNLVSSIGNVVYNFAISWFILELTGSALQAGTYLATGGLIGILLTPFAGVIADRIDRVKIVYVTDFIRGGSVMVAGVVVGLDLGIGLTIAVLYATTIVLSINGTLFQPAVTSLQADILSADEYQSANASMSLIRSFEGIIGVLLGGVLYSLIGVELVFLLNGASFVLSGISELFIRHPFVAKERLSWKSGIEDLIAGFRYLFAFKGLLSLMIAILLINFAFVPMFANVMPYMFNQILNTSPFDFSVVQISISLGMLLSAIVISNRTKRLSPSKSIYFGLSGMITIYFTVTIAIYWMINQPYEYSVFWLLMIGCMFVFGMINIIVNTPISTSFMKTIAPEFRGRSNATINVLSQAAIPLAIFLGGVIIELGSVVDVMLFGSFLLVFIWAYLLRSRSVRAYLATYE
jgi:MFS transporter, DHA3 family, macrolide efflux protein